MVWRVSSSTSLWGEIVGVELCGTGSRLSVTFFPLKAGLVWEFFPEGAQKSQTVLKPKAEGQSDSFGLLKERISRLDPTWAGRMTF